MVSAREEPRVHPSASNRRYTNSNGAPDCPPCASLEARHFPRSSLSHLQQMLSTLVGPLSWNAGAVPAASARCAQLPIGCVLLWAWQCGGGQKAFRACANAHSAWQSRAQAIRELLGRPAEHSQQYQSSTIRAALSEQRYYQSSTIRAEHSQLSVPA